MYKKAIWKPEIREIAYSAPYESLAARTNMLAYIGLCPTTIKLNPSWKTEVSKSAWIKPWKHL